MSDVDEFARECRKRLGLMGMVQAVAGALQVGLAGSCALVLLERLLSTGLGAFWAVALPLGGAACMGVVRGLTKWPGTVDAAVAADAHLSLQERLSSAIAPSGGPMADLVRADAAGHVEAQDPGRVFPLTMPWGGRRMVLLAVGLVICLLVPQADLLGWGEARTRRAGDSKAVQEAVGDAREEIRALGRRAADGAQGETARMLSEYERRLLAMLQQDRHTVRRSAREAASELEARAAAGQRNAESRRLLAEAAETMGRCSARLAREKTPGEGTQARGDPVQWAANPLVKAQEYDRSSVPTREPEQRWLDACEVVASAMASDAVPRRYHPAVQRYFAPAEPFGQSRRP